MSENKYIIDKDSLTGIADAVRNKLGNGEAITDEDAGYYPVPIKKLGYSQTADTASYSQGSGYTSSNAIYERPVSELVNICGIRPSYIKVTVTSSSGFDTRDIIYRFTNVNSPASSRVDSGYFDAKRTAILSIPSDIDDCYIEYGGYYSSYSTQYSTRDIPPYNVVFLDSNRNEININEYSGDSFVVNQWGTTRTFLTGTSFEKIPFSIDDIQDRITNYLGKKNGLIYRYHINPQKNESGTAFLGTPLSEMNVLDYGVTSVSQIKFMLIYGQNNSSSFTWYPTNYTYTMIINGKLFSASDSGSVYWPDRTSDSLNSTYRLQLCPYKLSDWPLGIMRGNPSRSAADTFLQHPRIVFMVLDLEATE